MTDLELDRVLRRVLLDALRADEENTVVKSKSFNPSWTYRRQIKNMLRDPLKWIKNRTKPVWKSVAEKVAIVFLIISVGLGSLMAVSPTVRAAVVRWVTEWYETHVTYRFAGNAISEEMPQYRLTALPPGYYEVGEERIEESNYIQIVYRNASDLNAQDIYFDYTYMQQGSGADYDTMDSNILQVEVNGNQGYLLVAEDVDNMWSTLIWIDEAANLQFTIDAAMDKDGILYMAESARMGEVTK